MMAPRDVLARLSGAGVRVRADGGRLRLECEGGEPETALLDLVRLHKPALLEYLEAPPVYGCSQCGRFAFPEPDFTCYWCRRAADAVPMGEPCPGCGEACERCLGAITEDVKND